MTANMSKISTLIIDDNSHMIHIVRTMLLGFGINRTYESRDAAEAFDKVRSEIVDLIIVDLQMPMLDGLEFTRLVRTAKDSSNPYVPIILLTAYTERSKICAARDAGVTEICAKPITTREMWTKICAVVNAPRPFVRTKEYFGPDRRRRTEPWDGEERRKVNQLAEKNADAENDEDNAAA